MSAETTAQPSQVQIPFAGEPRPLFIPKRRAAVLLGVSPGTIDRLRDDGEIEAINVRGIVMVLVSSLEAYIERQLDQAEARRIARQATRAEPRRRWTRPSGEAFPIQALDEARARK
ncbi:MAG TPA: helix-turn-helix domain-containing protein, partial [Gaiellales bacterium]|nr:helix-turn-helix domain-containing protein [Gaiellales bacterium]